MLRIHSASCFVPLFLLVAIRCYARRYVTTRTTLSSRTALAIVSLSLCFSAIFLPSFPFPPLFIQPSSAIIYSNRNTAGQYYSDNIPDILPLTKEMKEMDFFDFS